MRRSLLAAALLGVAAPQLARADDAATYPAPAPGATTFVATVINVLDADRAVAFYRDVFGLTLGITLDHGTQREYMMRFPGAGPQPTLILQHDSAPGAARSLERGTAFNRLVLRVGDLDAVVARLDALKRQHPAIRQSAQGYRILLLTDPEGTPIEVIQPAARPAPRLP